MYKCTYTDEKMAEITKFFVDGTFKCCPTPFAQLYIILGKYRNMSLPIVSCLERAHQYIWKFSKY